MKHSSQRNDFCCYSSRWGAYLRQMSENCKIETKTQLCLILGTFSLVEQQHLIFLVKLPAGWKQLYIFLK